MSPTRSLGRLLSPEALLIAALAVAGGAALARPTYPLEPGAPMRAGCPLGRPTRPAGHYRVVDPSARSGYRCVEVVGGVVRRARHGD